MSKNPSSSHFDPLTEAHALIKLTETGSPSAGKVSVEEFEKIDSVVLEIKYLEETAPQRARPVDRCSKSDEQFKKTGKNTNNPTLREKSSTLFEALRHGEISSLSESLT